MTRLAWLLPILLFLAACGADTDDAVFTGYVEGKFVDLGSEAGGRIVELAVKAGDRVEAGALAFRVDDAEAQAAVAQAKAELARAEAQLANLRQGQRPSEIAVLQAQIAEAQASLDAARKEFERQQELFRKRVVAEARLDQAREAVAVAEARVEAAERQQDVAEMPARSPEIAAGERGVEAAKAALEQAKTRLARHLTSAPVAGRVEDMHYELGEVAPAGASVLSLLPNGSRIIVFFVPEVERPALTIGTKVSVECDGCPAGLFAEIAFLGEEAEFTPPVIFSRENSGKLVFRAEASFTGDDALPLGQPVEVSAALRGTE